MRSQYLSAAFAAVHVLAAPAPLYVELTYTDILGSLLNNLLGPSSVPTEARDLDMSYARQMEIAHPESGMSDFGTIFRDAWRRVQFTGGSGSGSGSETKIEARGQLPCNEFGCNNDDENDRLGNNDSLDQFSGDDGCNAADNDGACNSNDDFVNSLVNENDRFENNDSLDSLDEGVGSSGCNAADSDGACNNNDDFANSFLSEEEKDEEFLSRADLTNQDVVDKSTPSIDSALDNEREANREWKDSFKEVLEKLVGGVDGNRAKKGTRNVKREGPIVSDAKKLLITLNDELVDRLSLKPVNAKDPKKGRAEKKKSDSKEKPKTKRAAERSDETAHQELVEDALEDISDQLDIIDQLAEHEPQGEKPGFWQSFKNLLRSFTTPRVLHRGVLPL